jgi:gas vesicle protein
VSSQGKEITMSQIEKILDDDGGSGIVWFIVGAALGLGVGMLLAPKSGRDTRRYLAERASAGRDVASNAGREMYERGKEVYDKGRHLADEATELFERGRRLVRGENPAAEPSAGPSA